MYLDPTNDIAFKKIFGNENKKEILVNFLNNILEFEGNKKIVSVEIMNPYQAPMIKLLKGSIFDVYCFDARGVKYIVEMQVSNPSLYEKEILHSIAKNNIKQIDVGEKYPELNQVIFLGILNFKMFDHDRYLSNHLILDEKSHENNLKDLRFCFIELPKFQKEENKLESVEDKWIYFLKNANKLNKIPEVIREKEIQEAFNVLDKFGWSKEELEEYDAMSIALQDAHGRIEQALMDGEKIGMEKGMERGMKEGKQEGIKEGKIEMGKAMLKDDEPIEKIIRYTGLSEEEIKNIKDS
jgi:predicted transposase/invertase (TIGR01784 family)